MKNSKNEFNKATISEQKTGNYNAVQGNQDGNSNTGSHSSVIAELPLHMVTEFFKVKEHEFMEVKTLMTGLHCSSMSMMAIPFPLTALHYPTVKR